MATPWAVFSFYMKKSLSIILIIIYLALVPLCFFSAPTDVHGAHGYGGQYDSIMPTCAESSGHCIIAIERAIADHLAMYFALSSANPVFVILLFVIVWFYILPPRSRLDGDTYVVLPLPTLHEFWRQVASLVHLSRLLHWLAIHTVSPNPRALCA